MSLLLLINHCRIRREKCMGRRGGGGGGTGSFYCCLALGPRAGI